jgi:Ribosome biogenesis protein SLX9
MKSRPGAMKRREKVDSGERERFAKNLAEMSGKKTEGKRQDSAKLEDGRQAYDRWAALRGFIAQTMEQRPEWKELKG